MTTNNPENQKENNQNEQNEENNLITEPKSTPFQSLLQTNVDPSTGIRYSTSYLNNLPISYETIDDLMFSGHSTDLTYESAFDSFIEEVHEAIDTLLSNNCLKLRENAETEFIEALTEAFNESYESYESVYLYEDPDHTIEYHSSDNSIIVLKSPYTTLAPLASPCFPNGCYIDDETTGTTGYKCYCLPSDWFENNIAPYKYQKINE